jgi:hypothetical protein
MALAIMSVSNAHLRSQLKSQTAQLKSQSAQLAALQSQLGIVQDDANKSQLREDNQNVRDAVAGIYSFDVPDTETTRVLDFRSDGTAQYYWYQDDHDNVPFDKKYLTWSFNQGMIYIIGQRGYFKPEGNDLIDASGNRWERER